MELTRKIIIFIAFIGVGFVAATLRMWFVGDRRNSLKSAFRDSFIFFIIFAAIVAVIIYINN